MRKIFYVFLVAVFMSGCSGTQYREAAKDKGSMEWGAREIKETVSAMVASLYDYLRENNIETFIEVKKIKNRTGEHIDTRILSDSIVTDLIKKRIRFIDRTYTGDALKEMEMGMTGLVDPDSAVPAGSLKSPNFYLYGEIRENLQYPGGKQKQYILVTLKLADLSGAVVWQDQKEFYKISSTTRVSR